MTEILCTSCGNITANIDLCLICGADPKAPEVACPECLGSAQSSHYDGPAPWSQVTGECLRCAHSGRPGWIEAPFVMEHEAHARRSYWMTRPLSEIPLRAPFKELREVIPEYMLYVIEKVKHARGRAPCACCGSPGSLNRGFGGETVCPPCTWMDWGHHSSLGISKKTASLVLRYEMEWRYRRWNGDPLVPAGLSADGSKA